MKTFFASLPVLPTLSQILPVFGLQWAAPSPLFPPLGDLQPLTALATIAVAAAATYIVFEKFRASQKARTTPVVALFLAGVLLLISYIGLHIKFVRTVPIPSQKGEVVVSVGYERTDFAKKLGDVSDIDMLKLRGPSEEEIKRLWTPRSLEVSRGLLWITYTFLVACWVSVFSIAVLRYAAEQAEKNG